MLLRMRLPYFLEEKFGLNMQYYILSNTPNHLFPEKLRHAIKENDLDDVKNMVFTGAQRLDDPVDIYTFHTMVHEAVTLDREELFEFLVSQGANLDMRDQNGYTPLLKAASIGRTEFCKKLIEKGVDPKQVDPYGNTPLDKAKLYNHIET